VDDKMIHGLCGPKLITAPQKNDQNGFYSLNFELSSCLLTNKYDPIKILKIFRTIVFHEKTNYHQQALGHPQSNHFSAAPQLAHQKPI